MSVRPLTRVFAASVGLQVTELAARLETGDDDVLASAWIVGRPAEEGAEEFHQVGQGPSAVAATSRDSSTRSGSRW